MLGVKPKDFDVVTNAQPEEIRQLFGNCRLIGRRFRLAHVHFGHEVIEVATYRADHDPKDMDGHHNDNKFGTIEEDAWRRDFRINALYYNINDFSVVDFTGGLEDISSRTLALIGDSEQRFREDPVRMLRAVRIAEKLGFKIEATTDDAIRTMAENLSAVSSARLYEEVLKMFLAGDAEKVFKSLSSYGLFEQLFPGADVADDAENYSAEMLVRGFVNTDNRVAEGKPVIPAFLFAFVLWSKMQSQYRFKRSKGKSGFDAFQSATRSTLSSQVEAVSIPRRVTTQVREIWSMQMRLDNRVGKRPLRLVDNPRFRAAYDFMLLRNQSGEALQELCDWWTRFQDENEEERTSMIRTLRKSSQSRPRKKRKKRSQQKNQQTENQPDKPESSE